MSDRASLLFDLPGFRVVWGELTPLGVRQLLVMQSMDEHACPRCGTLVGGKPYDVRDSRIKDLPFGQRPLLVATGGATPPLLAPPVGHVRRLAAEHQMSGPDTHGWSQRCRSCATPSGTS